MSLGDIVGGSGLAGYAQVGLLISFAAFCALGVWAIRRPRGEMEARARAVLDDEGTGTGEVSSHERRGR